MKTLLYRSQNMYLSDMMHRVYRWIDEPLARGAVAFNAVHKRTYRAWGWHAHDDYWEAFCVLSGNLRHLNATGEDLLGAGDMILLGTDCAHDGVPVDAEGCTFLHIAFPADVGRTVMGEFMQGYWRDGFASPIYHLSTSRLRGLVHLVEDLDPVSTMDRHLLILALLREARLAQEQQADDLPQWLSSAIHRVRELGYWEARAGDIAQWTGRSVAHCNRVMQQHRQKSITDVLNTLRLTEAARRLRLSNEKVIEVALAAGFGNLSHFHRCFKKQFHMTPRLYRQLVWREGAETSSPAQPVIDPSPQGPHH